MAKLLTLTKKEIRSELNTTLTGWEIVAADVRLEPEFWGCRYNTLKHGAILLTPM